MKYGNYKGLKLFPQPFEGSLCLVKYLFSVVV